MSRRVRTSDPAEVLLYRTRTRLTLMTLVMVTALVVIVGVTTAFTAITLMHRSIDRALDAAIDDPAVLYGLYEDESDYGSRGPLGEADTFVILTTDDGHIQGSTIDSVLPGLPDRAGLDAAADGDDRRDGSYDGVDIRLLTKRASSDAFDDEDDERGSRPLYLQAGFNLTLQHRLERQLILAISMVGAVGVAGALVVTLFVTRRAMLPIRAAFETERRFVATASHELQTPLSIIRASAEILQRESLVGQGGAGLVDDIIGETDRMGRLVSDLLALASIEAGAVQLDIQAIDLETWFSDLKRRAGSVIASRGLGFVSSPEHVAPPATTWADRDRLDQLVLILIDNATKHSTPGGVVRLDLVVDQGSGMATVMVSDQGPGIPIEQQARIFEPFARVPGTPRATGGSGLGLAIARQLAGRHGARLSVRSLPGEGATFSLALSLAPPRP